MNSENGDASTSLGESWLSYLLRNLIGWHYFGTFVKAFSLVGSKLDFIIMTEGKPNSQENIKDIYFDLYINSDI